MHFEISGLSNFFPIAMLSLTLILTVILVLAQFVLVSPRIPSKLDIGGDIQVDAVILPTIHARDFWMSAGTTWLVRFSEYIESNPIVDFEGDKPMLDLALPLLLQSTSNHGLNFTMCVFCVPPR
jgi:hypothetical protein